ncbi:hydrophobin [Infundibulicybe gibba]|nr:hydrophobin [Infundibulicybe gibba]
MFSKTILLFVASLALLTAATPVPGNDGQCNTGTTYCCNSVQESDSAEAMDVAKSVGISLNGVTGPVGLTCSSRSIVGIGGGAKCSQQPICCENNHYSGLIVIGCSPININL